MPWVGLTLALGAGLSVGVFKDSRPTPEGSLACTKHRASCAAYPGTAESLIPAATPLVLLYPETGRPGSPSLALWGTDAVGCWAASRQPREDAW